MYNKHWMQSHFPSLHKHRGQKIKVSCVRGERQCQGVTTHLSHIFLLSTYFVPVSVGCTGEAVLSQKRSNLWAHRAYHRVGETGINNALTQWGYHGGPSRDSKGESGEEGTAGAKAPRQTKDWVKGNVMDWTVSHPAPQISYVEVPTPSTSEWNPIWW